MRTFVSLSDLGRRAATLLVVALAFVGVGRVQAQAIPPGVSAAQPLPTVSTGLDALRRLPGTVALIHRPATLPPDQDKSPYEPIPVRVKNAVRAWEYLLLGLGIPYRVVDDAELAAGVDAGVRLLVLPGSEILSESQRQTVQRYVDGGGGLIAQGRIGWYDERVTRRDASDRFFANLFGAEFITELPTQPGGIFQQIDGAHMPTAGIDPGYLLNLTAQVPTSAARTVTSQAIGKLVPYNAPDNEAFRPLTMGLYGQTGRGRVVWTRFLPQDVSRDTDQQQNYVTLLINSIAYVTRAPVTAVRAWPDARLGAFTVAVTPLVGGRREYAPSLTRLFDAMAPAGVRPTVFVTGDEAKVFPDLMRRIVQDGELGLGSLTDDALKYRPLADQMQFVREQVELLAPYGRAFGFHPPAGYFDHNTIRAMEDAGLVYLLRFLPHPSMAPSHLRLAEDSDFRETVYGNLLDIDTLRVIGEVGLDVPDAPGIPSTALRTNTTHEQIDPPTPGPTAAEARRERDLVAERYDRFYARLDSLHRATGRPLPGNTDPRRTADLTAAERRADDDRAARRVDMLATRSDSLLRTSGGVTVERNRLSRAAGRTTATVTATGDGDYALRDTVTVTSRRYTPTFRNTPLRPTATRAEMRTVSEGAGLYERNDSSYGPRLDAARILAVGIWGRDDYEVTARDIERTSDFDAQLADFRSDLLDVLDARGLYVMNLHAEIQGLTSDRAAVPVRLAEAARQEGAWVTTLGEVDRWWRRRDRTSVVLTNLTDQGADLTLVNTGEEAIEGLSLDLYLNGLERGRSVSLSTTAARTVTAESDDRLTLVFPSLPPGTTRLRLTFEGTPSRTATR